MTEHDSSPDGLSPRTEIVRAGRPAEPLIGTVNPPIQRATTVLVRKAAALYDGSQMTYGRKGLATRQSLEGALAALEGAVGVRLYPTGLAAIAQVLMALLKTGDRVLVADHVYRPTRAFCNHVLKRFGVEVHFFPQRAPVKDLEALVSEQTRVIFLESPGSLSFQIQDVPGIAAMARSRGVLTVVDNTWAAGVLFRPLTHGVDVAIQALSKYVAGHSDVFMGSAACSEPTVLKRLNSALDDVGSAVSPEDAYLVLRSVRTLPTRLDRHGSSAIVIARWLEQQPEVREVLHPGLPSSADHHLWRRDYSGASGLFGVVLRPVSNSAVEAMLDSLKLFGLGFSWGGHESLAIHCDPQLRAGGAFPDYGGPLLRLHIGLEEPKDLIADLRHALDGLPR